MTIHQSLVHGALLASCLSVGCMGADESAPESPHHVSSTQGAERSRRSADDATDTRADAPPSGTDGTGHSSAAPIASDPGPSERPSEANAPTAQDQSGTPTDLEITRRIREALVHDGSLSLMARNATIITQAGVVTLRGQVSTSSERNAIERHARAVAGVTRVDDFVAIHP